MSRNRIYRDPYSDNEVRVLVEEYEELSGLRSKAWVQVRLLDIEQAYKHLPPAEKEAVLLCGFLGLTVRTAGNLLFTPKSVMFRRYMRGLDYLARYLNGVL